MARILTIHNLKKISTIIFILLILALYTAIKLPYFDYNFSGEHSMKYSSYVEPATQMVKNTDPLHYQQKYSSNPLEDNLGLREKLPQLPILEWKLAGTYQVFPDNSIETNTRVVMHMIGVFTIIFAFLSVQQFTNTSIATFFTLFLATNPIFGLSTFVTVYDSFNLMILFIALYPLILYLKKRNPIYLIIISATLIGLGMAAKISLFLWAIPIISILILYKSPNLITKIYEISIYAIFCVIPYAVTRYTIPDINTNTHYKILFIVFSIILVTLLTQLLQIHKENVVQKLEKLHNKKILLPIILIAGIVLSIISIPIIYSPVIAREFITDINLLFNIDVYVFMVRQFVRHIGIPLAILGILGIALLPFIKDRDTKFLGLSFLAGGIIFFLVGAKSIFFHDYYTVFLMAVVLLHAAIAIHFVLKKINVLPLNILLLILMLLFVLQPRIASTQERFAHQEEDLREAVNYLVENTEQDDFYIDEVQATYFSIYADRPRLGDLGMLEHEKFKKDVQNLGFAETMEKYNIKYLITFNEEPEYEKYANIFTEEELKRTSYRRTDLILSIVNPEKYEYFEDTEERERILDEYNVEEKFVFEKEIGNFRFFTFEN